ncbi:MAG: alkaline phosphatase family protein [Chitinophagaceae bacterium]|nr:MAG: alkaline phosphatase family protein [Chitinophagaceae bacterium]
MFCRTVFLLLAVFSLSATHAQDTTQQIIHGRSNHPSQYNKPYVILISIDGYRADFTEKHGARFLQTVSQMGVRAEYMTPSFPSLTFPNHYTLVTGLYPSHHGLVDNSYYDTRRQQFYGMGDKQQVADGSWYGGTPLWVLAEKQQLLSASFYWVASEADIQNTRPTYYYNYNEQIGMADRINTVKNWLGLPEEKRPHLITFYFPQVDHDAHMYGPDDSRVTTTVQFIDSSINALQQTLQPLGLPINYIVVSDHGMTAVNNNTPLPLPKAIDTSNFLIPRGDALLHLYAKDTTTLAATYEALKKEPGMNVYRLNETPAHWHYRAADDWHERLGNLILEPRLPNIFNITNRKTSPGKHGFDNHHPDMRASFMAWGPAFKTGLRINGFENIHVYPLIANLLGLKYEEKEIDGRAEVLKGILKQ